jgi:hypothetical protein
MGWREVVNALPGEPNPNPYIHNTVTNYLPDNLHGQNIPELMELAGDDWPECEANPAVLEAFARTVSVRKLRERGIRPDSYKQLSTCEQCGPIWLWQGAPGRVQGCVWCFNRLKV